MVAACEQLRPCRELTLLVTVTFPGAIAAADALELDVSIDAAAPKTNAFMRTPGPTSGTVEIDFPNGYPEGHTVTLTCTATQSGALVGTGTATLVLPPTCATVPLTLAPP